MLQQGLDVVILVLGLRVDPVRNNPYLQEFQIIRGTIVVLAVQDARSRAHELDFPARDGVAVVQAVAVAELPFQGNGNHFHILVGVGAEPFVRKHRIVIEYAKGSELHAVRIEIIGKTECVVGIQPPVVGMSPGRCPVDNNIHDLQN